MADVINDVSTFEHLLKTKYGDDVMAVVLEEFILQRMIDFLPANGLDYKVPVTTRFEHGITYARPRNSDFPLMDSIAGTVQAAYVEGYQLMLKSGVDIETLARSVRGKGELAYDSQGQRLIEGMNDSMRRRREISLWRGQTACGIVDTISGDEITLDDDAWVLGCWFGMEGALVTFKDPAAGLRGTLPGSGTETEKITAVSLEIKQIDVANRKLIFDTGAVASITGGGGTITVADEVIFASAHNNTVWNEAMGLAGVGAVQTGNLWSISVDDNSVWKPATFSFLDGASRTDPTFRSLQMMNMEGVNNGVGDDVIAFVSPMHFVGLLDEQAALRRYGGTMAGRTTFDNGARAIIFHSVNGQIRIKPTRYQSNGEVIMAPVERGGRRLKDWYRIGATEPTFNIPGLRERNIHIPDNRAGVSLRVYGHEAPFSRRPGHLTFGTGAKAPPVVPA